MVRIKFIYLLFFFFSLAPAAISAAEGLKVVATLFPTYDFVRQIGGDLVEVTLLLPPGVEAHAFSPTPKDMVAINHADIFVYTGQAMEPWAEKLLHGTEPKKLTVVDASTGVQMTGKNSDDHDEDHHNHSVDPHIWLDPVKAIKMVQTIGEALIAADPENRSAYQAAIEKYTDQLHSLDKEISETFSRCRLHTIISGGHFAFGNFAERYNIEVVSAYRGFSPDAKPGPRGIAELIKTMQKLGSQAVFHEELIEPKVARIIAEETGAKLLLLHGAHNVSREEKQQGATYLSIMRDNLMRLKEGLQCQ